MEKIFKNRIFSLAIAFLLQVSNSHAQTPEDVIRHLEINENYKVSWRVKDDTIDTQSIIFDIKVKTNGYIGFGISLNGAMNGADFVISSVDELGEISIEDRYGIGNQMPVLDSKQDWTLLRAARNESWTTLQISRLLNTGDDKEDLDITMDTLRLIWAYGDNKQKQLSYHDFNRRGFVSVNFLDPGVETPSDDELQKVYDVFKTQKTVHVSSNDTVYRCSFFKGPKLPRKHHIVGFGMFIDSPQAKKHLHHADLYRCTAPPGKNPDEFFAPYLGDGYDCNYSEEPFPYERCGQFEFQWTLGGGITLFPENLGMPIGSDDGSFEYFMTEVHFDNPQKRSDLVIKAGFNIYHTSDLREQEVGQLQLGFMTNQTYSLSIPPNSTNFVVSSHCPMDCTSNLPQDGINVFTYLLHSHLSGRKLKMRHFRDGIELPPLKDEHFDFNYQNNRRLRSPLKILPKDHLVIECTYSSTWKKGLVTLGGRSAIEEMCQGFLLYYPRIEEINSCGSYHKHEEILQFFQLSSASQYQGEIDATVESPAQYEGWKYSKIVENEIIWTPQLRQKYQDLVMYGEQQAYCIPIEYHNQSFVMTKYPPHHNHDGPWEEPKSFWTYKMSIVVYVSAAVFVFLFALVGFSKFYRSLTSHDDKKVFEPENK